MPTSVSVKCGYEWFQSKVGNSWYKGALPKAQHSKVWYYDRKCIEPTMGRGQISKVVR